MDEENYTKNQYQAYKRSGENLSEIEQVVLLYDYAISLVKQAKEAISDHNIEKRYNLIDRARAIMTGLDSCLEFNERTNKTAKALQNFYKMIDVHLIEIHLKENLETCDRVIENIQKMRDAWSVIASELNKQKPEQSFISKEGSEQEADMILDSNVQDVIDVDKASEQEALSMQFSSADASDQGTNLHI